VSIARCLIVAFATCAEMIVVAAPPVDLTRLDAEFLETAVTLARRAEAAGAEDLAATIRGWHVATDGERCVAFAIPAHLPARMPDADAATAAINDEFLAGRRRRAAGLLDLAVAAARAEQPVAAFDLLFRAVRDDPDLWPSGSIAARNSIRRSAGCPEVGSPAIGPASGTTGAAG